MFRKGLTRGVRSYENRLSQPTREDVMVTLDIPKGRPADIVYNGITMYGRRNRTPEVLSSLVQNKYLIIETCRIMIRLLDHSHGTVMVGKCKIHTVT